MTPYENLSMACDRKFITVSNNSLNSNDFFSNTVLVRYVHLTAIPSTTFTNICDIIIGVGAAVASIATLGKNHKIYNIAINHLDSARKLVVRPYANLLRILNPNANFSGAYAYDKNKPLTEVPYKVRGTRLFNKKENHPKDDTDGLLTDYVKDVLQKLAYKNTYSSSFLKKKIVTRLTYVVLAVALSISRVVDAIIGVNSMLISLVTFGRYDTVNAIAFAALQPTGIIKDLLFCILNIINPKLDFKNYKKNC